jgi:two-component system nitrate/nitrite response regulator NarL
VRASSSAEEARTLPYALRVGALRVVVVAEDPLARAGLFARVENETALTVVGQLSDEGDVARAAREASGQLALWDLGSGAEPRLDGLAQAAAAGLGIVALVHEDEDAAQALAAGARGALSRLADGPRLVAALAAVRAGLIAVEETLAHTVMRPRPPRPAALVEPLTPRESEVLQLLAQGLPNKAIAERLRISDHTAKFHVNAILGKLGAQTRTEAIVHAARLGLVLL